MDLTPSPLRAITRISTASSWVNIDGTAKPVILAQVGQHYFGAVGQYYFGGNNWATHELGIKPSDASELMLQISGTDTRPDADIHIGSLVRKPTRVLTFDLVPSPRVNG